MKERAKGVFRWAIWVALSLCAAVAMPASELMAYNDSARENNELKNYSGVMAATAAPTPSALTATYIPALTAQPQKTEEPTTFDSDSYNSKTLKISIKSVERKNLYFYVADIVIKDASQFMTAFAQGKYGKSYRDSTSKIAKTNRAILATNGDYCGFRSEGIIIRNNELFRDKPVDRDLMYVDKKGDLKVINEKEFDAEQAIKDGVLHTFSFGPTLVKDGKTVELPKKFLISTKAYEPRTAIGQVGPLHYKVIVADGRRKGHSDGMTMAQLAKEFVAEGCKIAYNLDGGGSSTLYFNGNVFNKVSGGGERSVSDILYFVQ